MTRLLHIAGLTALLLLVVAASLPLLPLARLGKPQQKGHV